MQPKLKCVGNDKSITSSALNVGFHNGKSMMYFSEEPHVVVILIPLCKINKSTDL